MVRFLNRLRSLIFGGQRAIPASCAEINEELERLSTTNLDVVDTVVTAMTEEGLNYQRRNAVWNEDLEDSVDFDAVLTEYLSGPLNKPLLIWIDGSLDRNPANIPAPRRHSCLLVVGTDYLALFNPGVRNPGYDTRISHPFLAYEIVQRVQNIQRPRTRGRPKTGDSTTTKVWYKTVEPTDDTGRLHCVNEAGELAAQLTSKQALPGLGYSLLR